MILGIGLDLLDTARFAMVSARHGAGFLEGLFTAAERRWCARQRRPDDHLAARFAAREALLKALGTGLIGSMSWTDMEVVPGAIRGTATMALTGAVGAEAARRGVRRIHLSLAVTRGVAAASVILESR